MKNYDEMTDSEINWRVHLLWNNAKEGQDFCNDLLDALPIITEHGISIEYWGDFWHPDIQRKRGVCCDQEDKNPLRAAMICYLKIKDDTQ